MRALIIDQSPMGRQLLRRLLETRGFEAVVEAGSSEDAVGAVKAEAPFTLLIVDWSRESKRNVGGETQKPEDGPSVVSALLSEHHVRHGAVPKILMISDADHPDHLMRAIRAGVDGYLVKPLRPATFVDKLAEVLHIADVAPLPDVDPRRPVPETTGAALTLMTSEKAPERLASALSMDAFAAEALVRLERLRGDGSALPPEEKLALLFTSGLIKMRDDLTLEPARALYAELVRLSLGAAACVRTLATDLIGDDDATLALAQQVALLHAIGRLLLLHERPIAYLSACRRNGTLHLPSMDDERRLLGTDHVAVALDVVQSWGFGDEVGDVLAEVAASRTRGGAVVQLVRSAARLARQSVADRLSDDTMPLDTLVGLEAIARATGAAVTFVLDVAATSEERTRRYVDTAIGNAFGPAAPGAAFRHQAVYG